MNEESSYLNSQEAELNQLLHDTRGRLNRISMHAELVKLVLENDMPKEKAIEATSKIIAACQDCSSSLEDLSNYVHKSE